jgi:hypothetical protein
VNATLPAWLSIVSGHKESKREGHSNWIRISTASIILAILFGLLANLSSAPSPEPSTTLGNFREVQEADFDCDDNDNDDDDVGNEDCALVPFNGEPSTDFGCLEDDSAPDGFAARFEALQDALPSPQVLWNITERFSLDLVRLVMFGLVIISCIALHAMSFLVTGRFGRRRIQMKELEDGKHSVRHLR